MSCPGTRHSKLIIPPPRHNSLSRPFNAITEYMAIDHFGITAPGESWKAVEEGTVAFDGRLPINPSGGLIGCGHPVGATGVRMLLDAWRQVSGNAGDYQVAGADKVAALNIGGSTTTTACFVVGKD